jgi:hypothetical protein
VFLTEEQAKSNIKELLAYDGLKLISAKQEERIQNFLEIINNLENVVTNKDSIISRKNNIIKLQEEIIETKKPIKFHSYIGMKTFALNYNDPEFYFRGVFEFRRTNLGATINIRTTKIYDLPYADLKIYIEYKLF